MTRASPGSSGAARSTAVASGLSAPATWSGTPRPSIPAGRPPTSCSGRTRTSASGSSTGVASRRRADATGRQVVPAHLSRWLVVLFLALVVVVDPQDLDEAEGGSQSAQG